MDAFLKMMEKWDPMGQGVFVLIVLFMILITIDQLVVRFVALFRGWPPVSCCCDDNDEPDEEEED